MTDTATLRQRLIAEVPKHGLAAGTPWRALCTCGLVTESSDEEPHSQHVHEADKALAVFVDWLREQAEGWRAAPDPLALDVYTDVVRDEFRRLADSIEAGDL